VSLPRVVMQAAASAKAATGCESYRESVFESRGLEVLPLTC
jgi:hypothetical protein